MQVLREFKKGLLEKSSLALGFFDGVHAGHQKVIKDAIEKARIMGLTSAVVTFSRHPKSVISPLAPDIITPLEERLDFFRDLGVNATVIIDFTEELAKMTAEEYVKNILQDGLGVKSISVGYNHRLGSDRKGTNDFLKEYCSKNDIQLSIISPVKINDHVASSSVIRGFIASGDMSSAYEFLGRPFKVRGEVVRGKQLGKKIGFPTANLSLPEELLLPLSGVYIGKVKVRDEYYNAVINVGRKPTVENIEKDVVEAHILNFDEDIYDEYIEILFLNRIRDEKKFESIEELRKQIERDCYVAAQYK